MSFWILHLLIFLAGSRQHSEDEEEEEEEDCDYSPEEDDWKKVIINVSIYFEFRTPYWLDVRDVRIRKTLASITSTHPMSSIFTHVYVDPRKFSKPNWP